MADIYKLETNFLETMGRMYRSSRILYEKEQYYNCCYLCGYILECALKYILLTFGRDENGEKFSVDMLKTNYLHNTHKLNRQLEACISSSDGIPPKYRINCRQKAPYMFEGRGGQKAWSPEYRYGEHPMWDKKEFCDHYMEESDYIFSFIMEIAI